VVVVVVAAHIVDVQMTVDKLNPTAAKEEEWTSEETRGLAGRGGISGEIRKDHWSRGHRAFDG
jgi:hypothetical protein